MLVAGVDKTNNLLTVRRAWMGSTAATHAGLSTITKLVGNFSIVENEIHFSEAAWGNQPIGFGTTATDSNEIDFTGLTTSSRFSGRVFLRSAINEAFTTSFVKAYDNNFVFDDLSSKEKNDFLRDLESFLKDQDSAYYGSNISNISDAEYDKLKLLYHKLAKNNPEIIDRQEPIKFEEGCLSVPGFYEKIDRFNVIEFEAQELQGEIYKQKAEGLLAVCIQHEIDHLNGILYLDHLSSLKRNMILKKMVKAKKEQVH